MSLRQNSDRTTYSGKNKRLTLKCSISCVDENIDWPFTNLIAVAKRKHFLSLKKELK